VLACRPTESYALPSSLEALVRLLFLQWFPIALAIGSAVLQMRILFLMKARNLRSQFPVFFRYNLYVIVAMPFSFLSYFYCCSHPSISYLYPVLSFLLIGFEFFLMYEVFVAVLKPYSALIDLGKMLFRWAGLFLLFAAVLTAFATSAPRVDRISAGIDLLERSMRLMECGLLMLFMLFERRLGLSWRSHSMSIALGLGTTAATGLAVAYLRMRFPESTAILGIVENLCYFGVVVFWSACIAMPAPERKTVLDSPSRLIFQRWNDVLSSYSVGGEMAVGANAMNSFLPGVEQTVERVLARKIVQ
jgi:hypothetical protein